MAKTYFYRDSNGNEVDLLIQIGEKIVPVEIKLSRTFSTEFLKGVQYWQKSVANQEPGWVVYTGESHALGNVRLVSWTDLGKKLNGLGK